ncbi:MAG: phosphate acyltransferase [Micavibrio sp.]|nr:phosphate acyltransferase [Micavibrio sp.]|tara:strand:+ start:380 stop:1429 length:1050 start_codon:yes stop_codon:yes gene_type:complete
MSQEIKIAVDAMGGDFGPVVTIAGAHAACTQLLKKHKSVEFLFFGEENKIKAELEKFPKLQKRSSIHHTETVVSSNDKPSVALRQGKDSSMALSILAVKEGRADCVVSAGNTGALMAMAKIYLRPQEGVQRPAIASIMPTMANPTLMLDLGANVSCDGKSLAQFAILGAVYARAIMKVEKPSVGILNIGSEDTKGHEEVWSAAEILTSATNFPGTYYGFVEGNDIGKGTVDVIVTDGFTGNVALKTMEGIGKMSKTFIAEAFKSSLSAMIGYLFCIGAMNRLKKKLDPRDYNGGLFLGLKGVCIKSHGGTDAYGFARALEVGAQMVRNDYLDKVAAELEKMKIIQDEAA